ncbi:MAG: hypothetical protein ACI8UZ_003185 [Akkermansiaceae bacterium]|jgi:hypothetical protein
MELPIQDSIALWKATDSQLRGAARRKFRAGVVRTLGRGGQCFAAATFGWSRDTIRKGERELATGVDEQDCFHLRGRKRAEHHLPNLLGDLKALVEPRSQTDPTLKSTRIYTPLSAEEIWKRLKKDFGYTSANLPCVRTIRNKLNMLGFFLKKSPNAVR